MSISLTATHPDSDAHKHFDLSRQDGIMIFDLCGAPFHEDVGTTTAQMAAHYATVLRRILTGDEDDQVDEEDRDTVENFATFCEHCGGYSMWA